MRSVMFWIGVLAQAVEWLERAAHVQRLEASLVEIFRVLEQ